MPASDRCNLDNNPLGDLCRFIDEHTSGSVAGPILTRLLWALVLLLIVIIGGRIVRSIVSHALERSRADAQLTILARNVLIAATTVVSILAALTAVGLPLSVLLTFGGLASLAVGLAFQDLLRNVLAGIFLLVERPFVIGDLITVGAPPADLTGSVQTIQLRTTSLRLGDGRLAVIPNLNAFNGSVVNANAYELRMFTINLWLPADSDIEAAMRTARSILDAQSEVESDPPPKIVPDVDIDVGITLHCQYWLRFRDHDPDAVAAALVERISAEMLVERHTGDGGNS